MITNLIRYNGFWNSLSRIKFVITESEIRYNVFPNYFLIGPKWASVFLQFPVRIISRTLWSQSTRMTEHFFVPLEVLRLDIRNVLRHEKIGSAQFIRKTLGFTEKQYENLDAENPTVKLASSSAIKGEIKEQSPLKIYIYFVQSCKPMSGILSSLQQWNMYNNVLRPHGTRHRLL